MPVDWDVGGVIRIGNGAPRWVPPSRIPIIPAAGSKDNAVVAIAPPRAIMPFGVVTSEGGVPLAFPVLGAIYMIVLLELHVLDFRVVLVRKVVVFCFYLPLVLVLLPTSVIPVAPI